MYNRNDDPTLKRPPIPLENPLTSFYTNRVRQLYKKSDSNKNDYIPSSNICAINNLKNYNNNSSMEHTTNAHLNSKVMYAPPCSSNYSIDDILSNQRNNGETNSSTPSYSTHNTPKSNNHRDDMPSLEPSAINGPIKTYQPLIYYPKKLNSYGEDSIDNRNITSIPIQSNPTNNNIRNEVNSPLLMDNALPYHIPSNIHTANNKTYQSPSRKTSSNTPPNGSHSMHFPGMSSNGQSHKVASSFHQMALSTNNTEDFTPTNVTEPSSMLVSSLPIEDQFKPMDYGFERVIARSKYGSETKVLKKFVIYVVPKNLGEIELRSKRDVARFLKNQPVGCNYQLSPENFNFDNTIHFNIDTRTIGKVPRLKKSSKQSDVIVDKHSIYECQYAQIHSMNNNNNEIQMGMDAPIRRESTNAESTNVESFNMDDKNLDVSTVSNPQQVMPTKKRGRPKGATSKNSCKAKRLKQLECSLNDDSIVMDDFKTKKASNNNGSSSLLKSKYKREKSLSKCGSTGGSKYIKVSKKTYDDQTIDQPIQLPIFTRLWIDYMSTATEEDPLSNDDICTTLANVISVYEFVQEFLILFPLMNRLSVLPPFPNVVYSVFSHSEEGDVLDLINSPFLTLCDCLLETYLNQKLPLPLVCSEMKVEFDINVKFNNVNIVTIVRLFIEEHLNRIAHLKLASSLSYNVNLKALVQKLKTTDNVLSLNPLLKSTFILFLIKLLSKAPCFVHTVDKIVEDFCSTRGAKWNMDGLIRKLKKHMASMKEQNLSEEGDNEIREKEEIKDESIDINNESAVHITTGENDCNKEQLTNEGLVEDKTVDNNEVENMKNEEYNGEEDEEEEEMEDDDDDDDHNSSRKLNKHKNANNMTNVVKIFDKELLDALKFDYASVEMPNTFKKCKELLDTLGPKQKVLKDRAFAFYRRLKGPSLGQDRFSRYYSIPYHSSCIFVEDNKNELELDNFINNVTDPTASFSNLNNSKKIEAEEIKESAINDSSNNRVELDNSTGVSVDIKNEESQQNGFTPLMILQKLSEVHLLVKCLNNLGMRERSLSKHFTRNIKNMSEDTLAVNKLYEDLSNLPHVDEPFYVVNPSLLIEQIYSVSVDQVIHLQYNQFIDFIQLGNVLSENEITSLRLPLNVLNDFPFVNQMKVKIVQLIHFLDDRGLVALVKKGKTNSKEAKSRYVKKLIDFVESVSDASCYDLELALTSLQLNISFEFLATGNNNHSPFNNKCCYACHLNVNFDRLLSCMYCYITYHSYCQGYQENPNKIVQDEWSCNHCKGLVCTEAEKHSFDVCRECESSTYKTPPTLESVGMIECEMVGSDSVNEEENNVMRMVNTEENGAPELIRCSLCLHWCHKQCVEEGNMDKAMMTNDIYLCPSCNDACRSSKAIFEGGRKRISKKFKMDICEMFTPCHKILHELYNHPCSEDFTKPVDLTVHHLYAHIIKKPIDLHLIDLNLKKLDYQDRDDFVADVRLVFENCKRYNQCDSEVYMAGRKMSNFFESRWNHLMNKNTNDNSTHE